MLRKIAIGGMAELYLAEVSGVGGFQKQVVVKRILPQLARSQEFFRMFLDEARIAATLQHSNIVQVYDSCEVDGEYFMAMEYLDGSDLRTIQEALADSPATLPLNHALYIVVSITAGLHYAHNKCDFDGNPLSIVHRDVTPHNIFLTREGGIKLVDFGIAKARGRMTDTADGILKGKLTYMSPEQCRDEPTDHRSDIFSLGIILYELTTRRRLYKGKTDYELINEIVDSEVTPPSAFMTYPSLLEDIVLRCLQKSPENRYQNAREIQEDIEKFAREQHLTLSALSFASWLEPMLRDAAIISNERWKHRDDVIPNLVESDIEELPSHDLVEIESDRHHIHSETTPTHNTFSTAKTRSPPRPPHAASGPPHAASGQAGADSSISPLLGGLPQIPQNQVNKQNESWVTQPRHHIATSRESAPAGKRMPADFRVTKSRASLWLGALIVAGTMVALPMMSEDPPSKPADKPPTGEPSSQLDDEQTTETSTEPPPEIIDKPQLGTLDVIANGTAEVWLFLGRTPVESEAIDGLSLHRIRVEHEGYKTADKTLDQRNWQREGDELQYVQDKIILKPIGQSSGRRRRRRRRSIELDGTVPKILRLDSDPPSAKAWLYIGMTPYQQISNIPTNTDVQVRIEFENTPPVFRTISASEFDEEGNATMHVPLPLPNKTPPNSAASEPHGSLTSQSGTKTAYTMH